MAARNPDSLTNQGEFHARVPPSEPIDKHGHKPGVRAAPKDHLPTFSAQTLDPGTAPADRTFDPQTRNDGLEINVGALEGMPGATSQDVNRGMGRPMQGMTSKQLRHDGQQGRKRQTLGLAKHGAGGEAQGVDERVDERQRGIEREEARPGRGDKAERTAEDVPGFMVTGKRP